MKFFAYYTNPIYPNQVKLVPYGFSWLVFFLGGFGLIIQKSWIHGLIIFSLCIAIYTWLCSLFLFFVGIHFFLACFAYHFKRVELHLSGWKLQSIIAGSSKETAFLRAFDRYSELNN